MRHCDLAAALLGLALATPAGAADTPAALLMEWSEAYAASDGTRAAALYTEDASLWGTASREQTLGRAAIATYFGRVLSGFSGNVVRFGENGLRSLSETVAVASGHYTFGRRLPDGSEGAAPSRFSMVMVKGQDGMWRIADHHSSRLPPAPN